MVELCYKRSPRFNRRRLRSRREGLMTLWRPSALVLAGLVVLADTPALAQGLNEVVAGRLSNSCLGLSGPGVQGKFPPPDHFNPDYGPQLLRLCGDNFNQTGTLGASSAGGITSHYSMRR